MSAEILREVKLDLKLRCVPCRNIKGKKNTTNLYSVLVDSIQVSEAVKGLCAVLHKKICPPTGRIMALITRGTEEQNERKTEMILTQHHKMVQNKKRIYCHVGTPL